MTKEEISSTIEQVKAQIKAKPEYKDKTDNEIDEAILDNFFKDYTDGKLSKEDLGAIADAMGYEFTEDFDKEEEVKEEVPAPGVTKTEAEDLKAMKPGETKEEFKEKVEEAKTSETPAPAEGDDEVKEREEASKLWGIDLTKKKEEEK